MTSIADLQQVLFLFTCLVVSISAVAAVVVLAALRHDLRQVLRPTYRERAERIQAQSNANRLLLETEVGRASLVEFFVSESNISAFFREAEEKVLETTTDDELAALLDRMRKLDKKGKWYSVDNLKKGAKAIGEKLFDKANDLVKPYLGGGSNEK